MPQRSQDPKVQPPVSPDAHLADVEVEARAQDAAGAADDIAARDQHPGQPSHPGVPLAPPGIAPESDVRVHTPSSAAPSSHDHSNDGLGELPRGYGDGRLAALVRDPETLFIYWDFTEHQVEQAFSGLGAARAIARLWNTRGAGAELVRECDVHLDARGWYLRDLPSGTELRVEIWAVGEKGARLIRAARPVRLPPAVQSDQLEAVYLRLPLDHPLRDGLMRADPLNYGGAAPSEWDRRLHPRIVADSSPGRLPAGSIGGGGALTSSPGGSSPGFSSPTGGKLPWSATHLVLDLDASS
jgi:uncharacterized protein